jgi:transcriptional regulator
MPDKSSDVVQGTLDMLVLKTLALEPMHGYGISVRIEQMSKGVFRLNAGSLFLAIQRLQRDGLVEGEWKATENNRRAKYYVLTKTGRQRLSSENARMEPSGGGHRQDSRGIVGVSSCPFCETLHAGCGSFFERSR